MEITIRRARREDGPALRKLWELCFPGEEAFTQLFFQRLYQPEHAWLLLSGGEIASMLHGFDYALQCGEKTLQCVYVYGVGTHPAHRGRGHAAALIDALSEAAARRGADALFLVPQEESLFDYYRAHGFETAFFLSRYARRAPRGRMPDRVWVREALAEDLDAVNTVYERAFCGVRHALRPPEHWAVVRDELRLAGGGMVLALRGEQVQGYACYSGEGGVLISESVWDDAAARRAMYRFIARRSHARRIQIISPGSQRPFASVRPLSEAGVQLLTPGAAYLNLMHN